MENQIRNNSINLLYSHMNNNNNSISAEEGIYNYSIKIANKTGINIDWKDEDFKNIYYNKLISTIEIILNARKLEFT
tara:strand:- start:4502 stop:4732 length:231 start_codon:yes stop_codon:yes gene_type:complete